MPINGKGWRLIGLYAAVLIVWSIVMLLLIERSPASIIVYVIGDHVDQRRSENFLVFQRTEGQWWWQRRRN